MSKGKLNSKFTGLEMMPETLAWDAGYRDRARGRVVFPDWEFAPDMRQWWQEGWSTKQEELVALASPYVPKRRT